MQSGSIESAKNRSSSSSARRRSMNWPIWLPMVPSMLSSSVSGSRISRLKNSMTPTTSPCTEIGNPKRGMQLRHGRRWCAWEVVVLGDIGDEGRLGGRPDPTGQTDASLERRVAAQGLEIDKRRIREVPRVDTAETIGVPVDLPEGAVLPPERGANRLEDARDRVRESSRFGHDPGRRVFGGKASSTGALDLSNSSVNLHLCAAILAPVEAAVPCHRNSHRRSFCAGRRSSGQGRTIPERRRAAGAGARELVARPTAAMLRPVKGQLPGSSRSSHGAGTADSRCR